MNRASVTVWLFAVASILSLLAALIPMLKGGEINLVYLGAGVVMLIVAIASAKKARTDSNVPPAP